MNKSSILKPRLFACVCKRLTLSSFFIIASFLVLVAPHQSEAQRSLEVYGGVGSTLVDVEKLAGIPLADWETFASGYSIQAFLVGNDFVSVGAEYGYTYMLFYTAVIGSIFIENEVEATRAMLMARLHPEKSLLIEGGVGAYFFDGKTDAAIGIGAGYKFELNESLSVPIKLRTDLVFTENTLTVPLTLNAGLAYSF
ncbi:MAG: hypothetical protein ABJG78_21145 [Cyclobacteriaceae bacterium]